MQATSAVEKLDPDGARERVAEDMGQDWVKDTIYRSDILQSLADDPGRIIRRLLDGSTPRRGLSVPVPKSSLTVRPAVDLRLIDRIAYQALVDSFAFLLLADVPDFVCGWRYARNPSGADDLASNSVEWRRYEEWLDDYWNEGARYVLVTDIAGFFQSVPHGLLRERLDIPSDIRNLLFDYLRIWHTRSTGLPQRVLASSLMANAYLGDLDDILSGHRSVRWMDDIVVFCDTRREGVRVMLALQTAMEKLGLYPNEAKTKLVPYDEAEDLIIDFRLRNVEYQLSRGDPQGAANLSDVWDELVAAPDDLDRTKFSFCVTRFSELEMDQPAEMILEKLGRMPHVSDHASRYLRNWLTNPTVLEGVRSFLNGRNNLFRWQEYRLATLFWHAERLTEAQLDFARLRVANANTYWAARSVFARAVAKHGNRNDALRMVDAAESELHNEVIRGLIIGVAEGGHMRPSRLKEMGRDDPELLELVSYLKSRDLQVPPLSF